jgi:predicted acylesterase/phospholipase RssA
MTLEPPRSRIALVIGSGGVKCAAALGLQQALRDEGIEIDLVVGCGGSLYATAAALGGHRRDDRPHDAALDARTPPRAPGGWRCAPPSPLFGFSTDFSFRGDSLLNARLRRASARSFTAPAFTVYHGDRLSRRPGGVGRLALGSILRHRPLNLPAEGR